MSTIAKKIYKICICLCRMCTPIRKGSQQAPLVRIIAFHDIPDQKRFKRVLHFLQKKYHIISPEDFEQKKFDTEKINLLLTFDDGYATWYSHVLPVFQELHIRGVFFVSAGFIAAQGDEQRERVFLHDRLLLKRYRKPLSVEQVEQLQQVGIIGAHTFSHKKLSDMNREELEKDFALERSFAGQSYAPELSHIAYPFGRPEDITPAVLKAARESGYIYGYTTKRAFVNFEKDYLEIPRTMIDPHENFLIIKMRIEGVCD